MKDFFISYHKNDRQWAEWMAWALEENGYSTIFQDWDFRPGDNFILKIQQSLANSRQTVAVISVDYLADMFTQAQWASAFVADPAGAQRRFLPIRVARCQLPPLLQSLVVCDLFDLDVTSAAGKFLEAVSPVPTRKPSTPPVFPGGATTGVRKTGVLAQAAQELQDTLKTTFITFRKQTRVRNELYLKMVRRLDISDNLEFEDFFRAYFGQMNDEELHLHNIIRAYTEDVLRDYNFRALEILAQHPDLKRLMPILVELERHLLVWKEKYFSDFLPSPAMSVLYVGVKEKTPFPRGVEDVIQAFLQGDLTHLDFEGEGLRKMPAFSPTPTILTINLMDNRLTQFPPRLFQLPNLRVLNIGQNDFDSLPDNIGDLRQLHELYVHNLHLKHVPDSIGDLRQLHTLDLGHNALAAVPASLGNLTNLTKFLYLSDNQLQTLPAEIANLTGLQYLGLTHNQFTELPAWFGALVGLRELRLYDNLLGKLPASLGNLTHLRELYLMNNQLIKLPATMGNLANLTHLDLRNNELTTLPDSFADLHKLTHLDLRGNKFTQLPSWIGDLPNLVKLDLRWNGLHETDTAFMTLITDLREKGCIVYP
jgi:Leucine-rich repeat (LRR) protein